MLRTQEPNTKCWMLSKKRLRTLPQLRSEESQRRSKVVINPRTFILRPIMAALHYHISYGNNHELIKTVIRMRPNWQQATTNNYNFLWKGSSSSKSIKRAPCKQIVSHLENHSLLTNKARLFTNMQEGCRKMGLQVEEFLPKTFVLAGGVQNKHVLNQFFSLFEFIQKNTTIHNLWIIKPADLNRGRGVSVFSTLQQLHSLLSHRLDKKLQPTDDIRKAIMAASAKTTSSFVLQKYIENPLLYKGRKFDLRVWVLVTHSRKVYLYREGYMRLASEEYGFVQGSIGNQFVHLTNNAIQKHSPLYGRAEDGNQLSFKALQTVLKKGSLKDLRWRMSWSLSLAIASCGERLWQSTAGFELLGADFMLDIDQNLYLIELNKNPSLEQSSHLLKHLMPNMINHLFQLTIDSWFGTQPGLSQQIAEKLHEAFPLTDLVTNSNRYLNMWDPVHQVCHYLEGR